MNPKLAALTKRFGALAREMQLLSVLTPTEARQRQRVEAGKKRGAALKLKAYHPPPKGIPHPFTKLRRYTLHFGDGMLRFTNSVKNPRRYPFGTVIVDNVTGKGRTVAGRGEKF